MSVIWEHREGNWGMVLYQMELEAISGRVHNAVELTFAKSVEFWVGDAGLVVRESRV